MIVVFVLYGLSFVVGGVVWIVRDRVIASRCEDKALRMLSGRER